MAVGSVIGQIRSQDADVTSPNHDVIYMLIAGGYGKFSVDFETGEWTFIHDNIFQDFVFPLPMG